MAKCYRVFDTPNKPVVALVEAAPNDVVTLVEAAPNAVVTGNADRVDPKSEGEE